MKVARYYIIFVCILSVSVLLLGLSYSSYSGTTEDKILREHVNEWGKIVFSDSNELAIKNKDSIDIGITNLTKEKVSYIIKVNELNNKVYDDVYYTINGSSEKKLEYNSDHIIYLDELSSYGLEGDYVLNNINIYSKSNNDLTFVFYVQKNNIEDYESDIENVEQDFDEGIINDSE